MTYIFICICLNLYLCPYTIAEFYQSLQDLCQPFPRLEIARGFRKRCEHMAVVDQPDRHIVPPVENSISFFLDQI